MSYVLVLGDKIIDQYKHFTATRICPEAPVPVLVPTKPPYESLGGAALVDEQLSELRINSNPLYGSKSRKERIIADDRIVCRLDYDSIEIAESFEKQAVEFLNCNDECCRYDAIIVSDYGKGSFTQESAAKIMRSAKRKKIPVLVDAKHNWEWYKGAFAFFPNERERFNSTHLGKSHIIQKRGALGCLVDGEEIPSAKVQIVCDCTGAGDVFIAAFAARLLEYAKANWHKDCVLEECAQFSNKVAGISVQHFGTHVVTRKELNG